MENILELEPYLTFEFNKGRTEFRLSLGRVKNLKFIKQE